uniref:Uncharacterized protein n=1 Tax=Anguilla anguilla TaxID=7936 RepID=A0A0E9SEY9_ANGAN
MLCIYTENNYFQILIVMS